MLLNSVEAQAILELLQELGSATPGLMMLVRTTKTPLAKRLRPSVDHVAYIMQWWKCHHRSTLSTGVKGGASAASQPSKRGRSASGHLAHPTSSLNPKASGYGNQNKANRLSGRAPYRKAKK
jgi:hypothetical protein